MKKRFSFFNKLFSIWKRIHLVDKCLIIFMSALLLQATFGIFFVIGDGNTTNGIDVIVRTSAAAIFGYFLSGNFARERKSDCTIQGIEDTRTNEQDKQYNQEKAPVANHLQIVIATAVGMFCLIVLTIIRNSMGVQGTMQSTHDTTATVSMFRDFISGCVGFLIGSPTDGNSDNTKG